MKKTLTLLAVLSITLLNSWAQGPNNSGTYYQEANGKKGEALKTALYSIIKNHKTLSYSDLEDYYEKTDKRPDGHVRDWYSNITNYNWNQHGNSSEGAGWNKEHTVPQSWFNEASPMKSDIIHVVPTDAKINNMRSSYVIAEVKDITKASANNYSILGSCKTPGYSGTVFEPNDEIKGDIARIYFYMATCYQDKLKNWTKGEVKKVFTNETYPGLQQWYLDMLFRWSQQDPVDEVERARNNAVAGDDVQKNRNPFVDYPGLEEYVWGSKTETAFSYDNYEGGGTVDPDFVMQPVFTPQSGSYVEKVEVSLSCSTLGTTIYYTTDSTEPTAQSSVYTAPITISETTTVKAIALKGDKKSAVTTATYTITQKSNEELGDSTILLNNSFFGVKWNGPWSNGNETVLSASQGPVTITYAKASSANMYCNDAQIRMYGGNTLKVETNNGTLTKLAFITIDSSKKMTADKGTIGSNYVWTGEASEVTFGAEGNHIKISGVNVTFAKEQPDGISTIVNDRLGTAVFNLQGQRTKHPRKGLYIMNGKKVILK
ncbi:MAG: endonuclease [Prevotella sp.]|nr:endonuclease [Prevotella sp.]